MQHDAPQQRHETMDPDDEGAELAPRIQRLIGERLKQHYDDLIQAPIPDAIMLLLAQLEAKETEGGR
jgi:hypothetical protein